MSYKPGKDSPIDPATNTFSWIEKPLNFADYAYHDAAGKVGAIRGFFREVKRVWDEPDWRKRAAQNARRR